MKTKILISIILISLAIGGFFVWKNFITEKKIPQVEGPERPLPPEVEEKPLPPETEEKPVPLGEKPKPSAEKEVEKEGIKVKFTGSTYKIASGKTYGKFQTGQRADILLSGYGFNNSGGPLAFRWPSGIDSDGKHLLLSDGGNHRILIWNFLPTGNTPPNLVLGQENFYSNYPGSGLNQLFWPRQVSTDGQRVVVADSLNERVLIWNTFPTRNSQPADLVIENLGWVWGVWTDGKRLVVSAPRGKGGKLYIWNNFPTQNNQPADTIFTDLGSVREITSDGKSLIVATYTGSETGAHFWRNFPTNNTPPDFTVMGGYEDEWLERFTGWLKGDFTSEGKLILMSDLDLFIWNSFPTGKNDSPDFTLTLANHPGRYEVQYPLNLGEGSMLALAGEKLYINGFNGSMIYVFNSIPSGPTDLPDFAIGAPDIYTNARKDIHHFIYNPVPASDGKSLFVASDIDKALYVWKNIPDESGAKPDIIYTFPKVGDIRSVKIAGESLVAFGNESLYFWRKIPLAGELPDFTVKDQGFGGIQLRRIGDVAYDERYFYLLERSSSRIYGWKGGVPFDGRAPNFYIQLEALDPGRELFGRISSDGEYLVFSEYHLDEHPENYPTRFWKVDELPNTQPITNIWGSPLSLTLTTHGKFFAMEDSRDRLFIWNSISDAVAGRPPDAVLGQKDFESRGYGMDADTFYNPLYFEFDGSYLWVGEHKWSGRILRFSPK